MFSIFYKYCIVGFFATLFHFSILITLVQLAKINPTSSAAIGAICGAIFAYLCNRKFTFSKTSQPHRIAFPRFILTGMTAAITSSLGVWVGTSIFGLHYILSQLITVLITLVITFSLNHHWTFNHDA